MLHLTLAGLSGDNKRLLLVSDSGEEYTLDIDARLRAALRGEHARLGQLEIQMESTLRPRDIQARIRAGESPDDVAQAAHTTVEKILPYANPVLAERAHVAQRAQRSSVRRKNGEAGARTLGDAVASQLRGQNVDPETVEWDAWRREDGRWALTASFAATKRKGVATFAFDAPGNFVVTENDDARWLVGDAVAEASMAGEAEPAAARDDLRGARQRRLSAVPADELPLGEDALELVSEASDESTVDLTETAARVRNPAVGGDPVELAPTPEPLADAPAAHAGHPPHASYAASGSAPSDDAEHGDTHDAPAPEARRPAKNKRGRASVPSWDEIMFGGGKAD